MRERVCECECVSAVWTGQVTDDLRHIWGRHQNLSLDDVLLIEKQVCRDAVLLIEVQAPLPARSRSSSGCGPSRVLLETWWIGAEEPGLETGPG